jgi:hypothetical protein
MTRLRLLVRHETLRDLQIADSLEEGFVVELVLDRRRSLEMVRAVLPSSRCGPAGWQ